jgi:hypothetical protein
MKRNIRRIVLTAALSTSFLCAQSTNTPPSPPTPSQVAANIVARLTTLLDLTSLQQATATTIFAADATSDQSFATQMQTAQSALETAITSNSNNGITAAANIIGTLTAQQVQADAAADAAFYATLTSAQQTKYTTLQPLGRGLGGPPPVGPGAGGPGGPGGPGGGH